MRDCRAGQRDGQHAHALHSEFADPAEAAAAYTDLERAHHNDPNLEIVLVGADSVETIRMTHGNYFDAAAAADASPYLSAVS